jgi:hypothetical protein
MRASIHFPRLYTVSGVAARPVAIGQVMASDTNCFTISLSEWIRLHVEACPEGVGTPMEEVKGKEYRQETVRPDGKLFLNCSFEDCLLCYGGERCEWENTRFANCRVTPGRLCE